MLGVIPCSSHTADLRPAREQTCSRVHHIHMLSYHIIRRVVCQASCRRRKPVSRRTRAVKGSVPFAFFLSVPFRKINSVLFVTNYGNIKLSHLPYNRRKIAQISTQIKSSQPNYDHLSKTFPMYKNIIHFLSLSHNSLFPLFSFKKRPQNAQKRQRIFYTPPFSTKHMFLVIFGQICPFSALANW